MPNYLVFQLHGPLSAWGDIAVGETRRSASHPSKSAILGLMAAALGINRNDDRTHGAMSSAYGFAVKVISAGTLLVDYHTVQVPARRRNAIFRTRKDELAEPKVGTLLSSREYRCDAAFIAALWAESDSAPFSLKELERALKEPKFSLYLGRKSCPLATQLAPETKHFKTLKAALDSRESFTREVMPFGGKRNYLYYWEEHPESGLVSDQSMQRWDLPCSRNRWQFSPRLEKMCAVKKEA